MLSWQQSSLSIKFNLNEFASICSTETNKKSVRQFWYKLFLDNTHLFNLTHFHEYACGFKVVAFVLL